MQRGSECGIFVGTFDQAQVQDRESSHYGLWQISIGSNDKLLYNSAKQHTRQHKYTLGLTETQHAASANNTGPKLYCSTIISHPHQSSVKVRKHNLVCVSIHIFKQ